MNAANCIGCEIHSHEAQLCHENWYLISHDQVRCIVFVSYSDDLAAGEVARQDLVFQALCLYGVLGTDHRAEQQAVRLQQGRDAGLGYRWAN